MQDSSAAPTGPSPAWRRQRRALLALGALVLAAHALFLGGIDEAAIGPGPEAAGTAFTVRTIAAAPVDMAAGVYRAPAATAAPDAREAPSPPPPPRPVAKPRPPPPRAAREPIVAAASQVEAAASGVTVVAAAASEIAFAPPPAPSRRENAVVEADLAAAASATPPSASDAEPAASAPAASAASAPPPLLQAGEKPPPVYRTQLPAPATLHYQVRSGFLRGSGEIRWQRAGDGYSLVLEARIAGLTLLKWSSEGGVDAAGLAPTRFVDQRARRAAQAANFQRDRDRITFSGPSTEWPLYPGTQDELSWMIQLAGIAAAEPVHLVEGGRITMVVVGARGEARVWNLRYAGRENVETASGTVHAVKLVRDQAGAYDRGYEIWLDPAHGYLPAHVTRRNGDGSSDFDILLERMDAGP